MWSVEALILFSLLLIYVIFIKFVMHLFRCCEFIMQMVTFNTVFVNVAYIFTMVFLDCVRVSKILVIWIIQYIYTLIMKHVDDQFSFFWISLSDLMCWKQNHFFFFLFAFMWLHISVDFLDPALKFLWFIMIVESLFLAGWDGCLKGLILFLYPFYNR